MRSFDVAVVGLGAMGSAAAWHLASRGRRVVALEQFEQGHVLGSSHGASRIYRLAYEHDDYVRLAKEALGLWRRLEDDAGTQILAQTGAIDFGNAGVLDRIAGAMTRNGVACRLLSAAEAGARWPGFRFPGPVLLSPDGGRTHADAARLALQTLAATLGADVRFSTPVRRVEPRGGGVVVTTDEGDVEAAVAVVTVNAWAPALLAGIVELPPVRVTQEQPAFFAPRDPHVDWPSFIHYAGETTRASDFGVYGLESPGDGGVKVGEHGTGPEVDPDGIRPPVQEQRLERLSRYVDSTLPGLDPEPLGATRCLYATTPSEDFIIDRVGNIVVGAGFSGHGFKFVPAIGRLLADLADGVVRPPARFSLPSAS